MCEVPVRLEHNTVLILHVPPSFPQTVVLPSSTVATRSSGEKVAPPSEAARLGWGGWAIPLGASRWC